jgi:hypothetical protein
MTEHKSFSKELAKGTGLLLGHVIAVVVGLALMVLGIALGVTLVALPVGIAVGFAGLFVFGWGLFGWSQQTRGSVQPPGPK